MRASAREIAKQLIGYKTQDVYEILKDMGYIVKDKIGWSLTEAGRNNGGKMSKSNYPVPTFDVDYIISKMTEYYKEHKM